MKHYFNGCDLQFFAEGAGEGAAPQTGESASAAAAAGESAAPAAGGVGEAGPKGPDLRR